MTETQFVDGIPTPKKTPRTCLECEFSACIDTDAECDHCRNFDKKNRECRCSSVESNQACPNYTKAVKK